MKIWQLFSSKKKWTQKTYARFSNGHQCLLGSAGASRWCLMGALHKCYSTVRGFESARTKINDELLERFKEKPIKVKSISDIVAWNDTPGRKFSEVKALVKKLNV